jgi:uncharacterized metal-binding protein
VAIVGLVVVGQFGDAIAVGGDFGRQAEVVLVTGMRAEVVVAPAGRSLRFLRSPR